MGDNQNWYRQLLALVLLSVTRAAVDFITNPSSREEAGKQLRDAFQSIDYDAAARALTKAIDDAADTSKDRLNEAIDALHDRSVDAVGDAKTKAERQLAHKRGGRKMRFLFGLLIGAAIAYFMLDEQRRDELLDRLTGASGPIEQATQSMGEQVTTSAQQTVEEARQESQSTAGTETTT